MKTFYVNESQIERVNKLLATRLLPEESAANPLSFDEIRFVAKVISNIDARDEGDQILGKILEELKGGYKYRHACIMNKAYGKPAPRTEPAARSNAALTAALATVWINIGHSQGVNKSSQRQPPASDQKKSVNKRLMDQLDESRAEMIEADELVSDMRIVLGLLGIDQYDDPLSWQGVVDDIDSDRLDQIINIYMEGARKRLSSKSDSDVDAAVKQIRYLNTVPKAKPVEYLFEIGLCCHAQQISLKALIDHISNARASGFISPIDNSPPSGKSSGAQTNTPVSAPAPTPPNEPEPPAPDENQEANLSDLLEFLDEIDSDPKPHARQSVN